jgi:inner membrane protein
MPTIITHAAVGAGLSVLLPTMRRRGLVAVLSAGLAMLPDADVIGLPLGVPWTSIWSHRGISHSLVVAIVAGLAFAWLLSRDLARAPARPRDAPARLAAYFVLVAASHGLLDALTDGGLGVAFFAPFSARRFFFRWRPIAVSPLGLAFFSEQGLHVLESELYWVWLPFGLLVGTAVMARSFRRRAPSSSA